MKPSADTIREALLRLARERGPNSTFCPSEAARTLAVDWRPLMPSIREEAAALVAAGALRCTQRGQPADPLTARGPIRLGTCEGADSLRRKK